MGDLNPFSFSSFDYLTPTFKYKNDPKKLDAAVRDGDPEALMWKRAPASMNANGGRTRIGGSIATGARSATPTAQAPAPRLQVGASLPPSSASVHADAPTSVQLSADAQKQFDAQAANHRANGSRALGGNASPVGGA